MGAGFISPFDRHDGGAARPRRLLVVLNRFPRPPHGDRMHQQFDAVPEAVPNQARPWKRGTISKTQENK
jgi:hypothetical protein